MLSNVTNCVFQVRRCTDMDARRLQYNLSISNSAVPIIPLLSGHVFLCARRNLRTGGSEHVLCGLDEVRAIGAPSLGDIVTAWRLREFVFLFMSGLRE